VTPKRIILTWALCVVQGMLAALAGEPLVLSWFGVPRRPVDLDVSVFVALVLCVELVIALVVVRYATWRLGRGPQGTQRGQP
jgi:hypothetical protein